MGGNMFNFEGPFTDALTKPGYEAPPTPARNSKLGGALGVLSQFLGGVSKGRLQKYQLEENKRAKQEMELERVHQSVMNDPSLTPEAKNLFEQKYAGFKAHQAQQAIGEGLKSSEKGSLPHQALSTFGKIIEGLAGPVPKGQKFDANAYNELMAMGGSIRANPEYSITTHVTKAESELQKALSAAPKGAYFQDVLAMPGVQATLSNMRTYDPKRHDEIVRLLEKQYPSKPEPGSMEESRAKYNEMMAAPPPQTRAEESGPPPITGPRTQARRNEAVADGVNPHLPHVELGATMSTSTPQSKVQSAMAAVDPQRSKQLFGLATQFNAVGNPQDKLVDGKPTTVVYSKAPGNEGWWRPDGSERIDNSRVTPIRAVPQERQRRMVYTKGPNGEKIPVFQNPQTGMFKVPQKDGSFIETENPPIWTAPWHGWKPDNYGKEFRSYRLRTAAAHDRLINSVQTSVRSQQETIRLQAGQGTISPEKAEQMMQEVAAAAAQQVQYLMAAKAQAMVDIQQEEQEAYATAGSQTAPPKREGPPKVDTGIQGKIAGWMK